MNRYLITTADERSWKFDRPVLFIGEECRRYDRKHIWSKMDAIVAEPYTTVRLGQKLRDISYVLSIARQLLKELIMSRRYELYINLSDRPKGYEDKDGGAEEILDRYCTIEEGAWSETYMEGDAHCTCSAG